MEVASEAHDGVFHLLTAAFRFRRLVQPIQQDESALLQQALTQHGLTAGQGLAQFPGQETPQVVAGGWLVGVLWQAAGGEVAQHNTDRQQPVLGPVLAQSG